MTSCNNTSERVGTARSQKLRVHTSFCSFVAASRLTNWGTIPHSTEPDSSWDVPRLQKKIGVWSSRPYNRFVLSDVYEPPRLGGTGVGVAVPTWLSTPAFPSHPVSNKI